MRENETRITCYAQFPGESCMSPADASLAPDFLQEGANFWIDILNPRMKDTEWLGRVFGFHALALSDVMNNETRPKQETYDGMLFTVFSAVNLNPGEDILDTINLNLFLTPKFLVTTHCKPLKSVEQVIQVMEKTCDIRQTGPDFLYYQLLDGVIDRYFDVMDELEDEIDALELDVMALEDGVQGRIMQCKRRFAHLRRSMGPKREALRSLVYNPQPLISSVTQTHLRDVLDHVMLINDNLESYRELLGALMDTYLSQLSQRMNEVMKLLSIIATIMLPLSFLTGLFGMNFVQMPLLHWRYGFWALMGFMGLLICGMIYLFRRNKML
ncbi:magnesium/cobalt transporter CorA [Candidatus Sumerlaeota bacterium]|nr:magnesium/cobalt transporter CorA [Candidatus Sumerlaeota bacterium]